MQGPALRLCRLLTKHVFDINRIEMILGITELTGDMDRALIPEDRLRLF
jgi:hypothetical protein